MQVLWNLAKALPANYPIYIIIFLSPILLLTDYITQLLQTPSCRPLVLFCFDFG